MSGFIKKLGEQVGGSLVGEAGSYVGDLLFGDRRRKNQLQQQQKLTDMGTEQAMKLQESNREQALQMWKDTNFSAQMDEMRKAGLNPAMIYGGGGEGAVGTVGGGGANNAEASDEASLSFAETSKQQIAMQRARTNAEIDVMKSQADKNKAEADATRGYKAEEAGMNIDLKRKTIDEITEGIKNKKVQRDGMILQNTFDSIRNDIQQDTAEEMMNSVRYQNRRLAVEIEKITLNNEITREQKEDILQIAKEQINVMIADVLMKNSQSRLNEEEAMNMARKLNISESDVQMKETVANIMKTKPNVWNVAGDELEKQIRTLRSLGNPIDKALNWVTGKKLFGD